MPPITHLLTIDPNFQRDILAGYQSIFPQLSSDQSISTLGLTCCIAGVALEEELVAHVVHDHILKEQSRKPLVDASNDSYKGRPKRMHAHLYKQVHIA